MTTDPVAQEQDVPVHSEKNILTLPLNEQEEDEDMDYAGAPSSSDESSEDDEAPEPADESMEDDDEVSQEELEHIVKEAGFAVESDLGPRVLRTGKTIN